MHCLKKQLDNENISLNCQNISFYILFTSFLESSFSFFLLNKRCFSEKDGHTYLAIGYMI